MDRNDQNRVVAIIQARMGSSRLSGKILRVIEGRSILEHVLARVGASRLVNDVAVATTVNRCDLEVVGLCARLGVSVYCGSEDDVLDRYYQAARLFHADHVVRITADCPMMDPKVIDRVMALHLEARADYTTNTLPETFPDGLDVEAFSFAALKDAWENAGLTSEREHVTPYLRQHSSFTRENLAYPQDLSGKRWTVDNAEDYEFVCQVFKALYHADPLFGMEAVLDFVREHSELEQINQHIARNEGYAKSLAQDAVVAAGDLDGA